MMANDCVLFCIANRTVAQDVKAILKNYPKVSGQSKNYHKLIVQFSEGTEKAKARYLNIL